jgi:hypothetical protein
LPSASSSSFLGRVPSSSLTTFHLHDVLSASNCRRRRHFVNVVFRHDIISPSASYCHVFSSLSRRRRRRHLRLVVGEDLICRPFSSLRWLLVSPSACSIFRRFFSSSSRTRRLLTIFESSDFISASSCRPHRRLPFKTMSLRQRSRRLLACYSLLASIFQLRRRGVPTS